MTDLEKYKEIVSPLGLTDDEVKELVNGIYLLVDESLTKDFEENL